MDYVELNRRFEDLRSPSDARDSAYSFLDTEMFFETKGQPWNDLLSERIVVVLGEPGSGKTEEFKHQAEKLSLEGHPSFFLRLDQVLQYGLQEALGAGFQKFEAWKADGDIGYFFLDSVDEAKFQNPTDFAVAITRVANAITVKGLWRSRILISSRVSAWKHSRDADEVWRAFAKPLIDDHSREAVVSSGLRARYFGARSIHRDEKAPGVPSGGDKIKTVTILPLARAAVGKFAQELGLETAEAFLAELDSQHAWNLARRPLDVIGLIELWKEKGCLGSLTEIVRFDVELKLRASDRDAADPLTPAFALCGAETLGAAVILCQDFTIRLRDEVAVSNGGVDPSQCLGEGWTPRTVHTLLDRPLFDGAVYGCVRFHHRQSPEYLCACWVARRLTEGLSISQLKALLFFRVTESKIMCRPRLAPVVAWLSAMDGPWQEELRSWILKYAPDIHLRYGDPGSLSVDYRKMVIERLVDAGRENERVWVESNTRELSLLADPSLSPLICRHIQDGSLSRDVRAELIMMVRHAKLECCDDALLAIAINDSEERSVSRYAIAAIRDMGNLECRRKLYDAFLRKTSIPSKLGGLVCEAVYPTVINAAELGMLLEKIEPPQDEFGDIDYQLSIHLADCVSPEIAPSLLTVLMALVVPEKSDSKNQKEEVSRKWVIPSLLPAVKNMLRRPSLSESEAALCAEALRCLESQIQPSHIEEDKLVSLNEATGKHPAVRCHYFWLAVNDFLTRQEQNRWFLSDCFQHQQLLRVLSSDEDWLLQELEHQEDPVNLEVILRSLLQLSGKNGLRLKIDRSIRQSKAPRLLKNLLSNLTMLSWKARFRMVANWCRVAPMLERGWPRRFFRKLKNSTNTFRAHLRFLFGLEVLRSGKAFAWLAHLVHEACDRNSLKWTPVNWMALTEKRGSRICSAVQEGCMNFWRNYTPCLPHESGNPNQTDVRVIVGLAGLKTSFDQKHITMRSMTDEEVQQATRYALHELNGFPDWFSTLVQQRPDAVRPVLRASIEGVWHETSKEGFETAMSKVGWRQDAVSEFIGEIFLSLLEQSDPASEKILYRGAEILLSCKKISRERIIRLAEERLRCQQKLNKSSLPWLRLLMAFNADVGLGILENRLAETEESGQLMVALCASMHDGPGSKQSALVGWSYQEPQYLKRFIPLVYKYVKPEEDIARVGSYSPGPRDDAQHFREGLLDRLGRKGTSDAEIVLQELARDDRFDSYSEWIQHLVIQSRQLRADLPRWTPGDVRLFAQEYEIEPKIDYDLYRIVLRRLSDIKGAVEIADNSCRGDLRAGDDEVEFRKWISRELIRRSRGRYRCPEEVEIDDAERPDIRIEHPTAGTVPIEAKWAERWTGPKLVERLRNQLVGQYLRDPDSRYGIYLLGYIDKDLKQTWEPEAGGRSLNFTELVQYLQTVAKELVQQTHGVDGLEVIGINFLPRGQQRV